MVIQADHGYHGLAGCHGWVSIVSLGLLPHVSPLLHPKITLCTSLCEPNPSLACLPILQMFMENYDIRLLRWAGRIDCLDFSNRALRLLWLYLDAWRSSCCHVSQLGEEERWEIDTLSTEAAEESVLHKTFEFQQGNIAAYLKSNERRDTNDLLEGSSVCVIYAQDT